MLLLFAVFLLFNLCVCDPGCSFKNKDCLYNVKLGLGNGCDVKVTSDTVDGVSCCGGLSANVQDLQNKINQFASKVSAMHDDTKDKPIGHQSTSPPTANEQRLMDILAQKEAELKASRSLLAQKKLVLVSVTSNLLEKQRTANRTKEILAQIDSHSHEEIRLMKDKLANVTRDLDNCNGVLALKQGKINFSHGTQENPFNVTYCHFEDTKESCFKQDTNDGAEWYRMAGASSITTGPKEDHTYGSPKGFYMAINPSRSITSRDPTSKLARMTSEVFPFAPNYCIRFWYNMFGSDIKTMNVYAKVGKGFGYPIWTNQRNHGQDWHLGEVEIDSEYTSKGFQVVFEATDETYYTTSYVSHHYLQVKHGANGDIALDDVYIYDVKCKDIPTCPPGSFIRHDNKTSSCYTFHTTPDTWYGASVSCHREGATSHLVAINSKEEQEYLVETIKAGTSLSAAGSFGWFTSGNDERKEHNFEWTDTGTPYAVQYTDWHKDQPNNVANDQNCLLMQYADDGYEWGDVKCTDKHPFICEVDLPVA